MRCRATFCGISTITKQPPNALARCKDFNSFDHRLLFFSVVVFVVVHCRFAKVKGASSLPRTIHLFGGMEFLLSVHCSRFPVLQQVHYIRNCCTISVNRSRANQQQQNNIMNGFNFISQSAHLMVFAQNVWVSNTIYMASICFFLLLFQS